MRVICPYEPAIHPLCARALSPDTERVRLGPNPYAYWRLVTDLWARGESFMLVEHDIELVGQEVGAFEECTEPWCVFPYAGSGANQGGDPLLYCSLGCVRFSSSLLASEPDVPERASRTGPDGPQQLALCDWRRLDSRLAGVLRKRGYASHVHWPAVTQHHVYRGLCSCGENHDIAVNRDGRYVG